MTDVDMFIEKGMHGGISYIANIKEEANNKYMSNCDANKPSKYIMYLDANKKKMVTRCLNACQQVDSNGCHKSR